jgi:hypothetical protein
VHRTHNTRPAPFLCRCPQDCSLSVACLHKHHTWCCACVVEVHLAQFRVDGYSGVVFARAVCRECVHPPSLLHPSALCSSLCTAPAPLSFSVCSEAQMTDIDSHRSPLPHTLALDCTSVCRLQDMHRINWGRIPREEAVKELTGKPEGTFLLRMSQVGEAHRDPALTLVCQEHLDRPAPHRALSLSLPLVLPHTHTRTHAHTHTHTHTHARTRTHAADGRRHVLDLSCARRTGATYSRHCICEWVPDQQG